VWHAPADALRRLIIVVLTAIVPASSGFLETVTLSGVRM
jgi:hypothetical protein